MGFWVNKNDDEYTGVRTKNQEIGGLVVSIAFVCLFIWLTIKSWQSFVNLEEHGGTLRLDSFSYLLYKLGGKWLATALWPVCAVLFAYMGFKRLKGIIQAEE